MTSRDQIALINPKELGSIEECDDALLILDEAIAKISTQLDYATLDVGADKQWTIKATAALRLTTAKRTAVAARRGSLLRNYDNFIIALKEEFDPTDVDDIIRENRI